MSMPASIAFAPLRVPLEVIERILFFALDGDGPLATPWTCVEPISPPVGTSHLLLVSKRLRKLALPLYWRSITILRADDWIKLWDPEEGLLVGETGQRRASWVDEIRINVAFRASIPIHPATYKDRFSEDNGSPSGELSESLDGSVLANLPPVALPGLKRVCFFDSDFGSPSDSQPGRIGPGDEEWLDAAAHVWERNEADRFRDFSGADKYDVSDDEFDDWYEHEDTDEFDAIQKVRETAMRSQRWRKLAELLHLDTTLFTSIRTLIDSRVFNLLYRHGRHLPRPKIVIYAGVFSKDWDQLKRPQLYKRTTYHFVGIPGNARTQLTEALVLAYGQAYVKRWRYIGKNGKRVRML